MSARQLDLRGAQTRLDMLRTHTSDLPTHIADQLEAAGRDQRARFERLANSPTFKPGTRGTQDDPTALLLFDRYLIQPILDGTALTCAHLRSPSPIFVLAAYPGALWCERCFPKVAAASDRDPVYAASDCDLCGDHAGGIYRPTVITMTTASLFASVCSTCAP